MAARLVSSIVETIDRWQQRYAAVAVAVAVWRKAGEDRAGDLAAVVAFYGFFSLFPLLLLLGTVLGFVLQNNPDLRADAVDAAVAQFPQSPELRDAITTMEGNGWASWSGSWARCGGAWP